MNLPWLKTLWNAARGAVKFLAPSLYRKISFYRNEGRLLRIGAKLVDRYGAIVLNGPFKGMRYVSQSRGSVLSPKLVGSYEAELQPFLEKFIARGYDTVIDVGCAEGYYAVGLLLRMGAARCVAFDLDLEAQGLCRKMAEMNGVLERLEIRGSCDTEALGAAIRQRAFILSDCEGAEEELLDPALVPNLRECDLLVELHDFIRPGVSESLKARFAATHQIEIVDQAERDSMSYHQLNFLGDRDRALALQEFRPGRMQWAVMTTRRGR